MATQFIVAVSSLARSREALAAPQPSLLWRADLRPSGYEEFRSRTDAPNNPWFDPLCFSGNGTLISSFVTREGPQSLARRGSSSQLLPFRLHAMFMDSANGGLLSTHQWPIPHPTGGILCAPDSNFIVATPERLMLYSPELNVLAKLGLSDSSAWDVFHVFQSPDGKSLMIDYGPTSPGPRHVDAAHIRKYLESVKWLYWWVDGSNLHLRREWIAGIEPLTTIFDSEVVTIRGSLEPGGPAVMSGTPGGPSRPIWTGPSAYGTPQSVSDRLIALIQLHRLELITTDGEPILSKDFPSNWWLGVGGHFMLRQSAGGSRFAITIWGVKGGNELLDISGRGFLKRIMVFDISSRKWVYMLDTKKCKIKKISGLALSPDGKLMALINQDGILETFHLPSAEEPASLSSTPQPGPR